MTTPKKVVLITGCSSGIGLSLAEVMTQNNCVVYATARHPESVDALSEKQLKSLNLDVTDSNSIKSAVDTVIKDEGRLDILINNAGYAAMGPCCELSVSHLKKQFDTNVFGLAELIQCAVKPMMKQGSGLIVNIGSVSGITTTPFSGFYCASKAAVHSLSDALRMELAPFNIKVVTVQPGGIQSSFGETAKKGVDNTLDESSFYWPIKDAIHARAVASQNTSTTATSFSEKLVAILLKEKVPSVIRLGDHSILMPFLKRWLPTPLLDKFFIGKFSLNRL